MLFVPLAGEGGYNSRLSDFLNNPDKHFLALTAVKVEALPECIVGMMSIVDNPHPIVIYSTRALKHKNVKRFRLEFSWT